MLFLKFSRRLLAHTLACWAHFVAVWDWLRYYRKSTKKFNFFLTFSSFSIAKWKFMIWCIVDWGCGFVFRLRERGVRVEAKCVNVSDINLSFGAPLPGPSRVIIWTPLSHDSHPRCDTWQTVMYPSVRRAVPQDPSTLTLSVLYSAGERERANAKRRTHCQ